jgi:tripartite-type tricarboxylate transporter receptor subunit TctC
LKHTRRRHLQVIAAAAITPALPRVSCAQSWPAKPIRVIIPFTAGSTIDIVARIVFEPLGRQLGQALVIDNRGGAGGTVGAAAVARAEPDGYTLMAHSSAHVTTPAIYPNAPYDTAKDFAVLATSRPWRASKIPVENSQSRLQSRSLHEWMLSTE